MKALITIGGKKALRDYIASRPLKAALFTAEARLDAGTDKFSPKGELSGRGYAAGGIPLVVSAKGVDSQSDGQLVAYLGFANATWSNAEFIGARYLQIYDAEDLTTHGIIDFGADKNAQGADFTYKFPAKGGVIRI